MLLRSIAPRIVGVGVAAASIVGCQNTIELPAPHGGPQSETDVPGSDGGSDSATETSEEDTFDPGNEYVAPPDCGTLDGESDDADLSNGGIRTGTRFCEIYRDILHHTTGSAKCQTLHCHGGDKGQHDLSMGWTLDDCYKALTTYTARFFEPDQQLVTPSAHGDSTPVSALPRYVNPNVDKGEPFMPFVKSYLGNKKLSQEDWQRLLGWLQRGAPKD